MRKSKWESSSPKFGVKIKKYVKPTTPVYIVLRSSFDESYLLWESKGPTPQCHLLEIAGGTLQWVKCHNQHERDMLDPFGGSTNRLKQSCCFSSATSHIQRKGLKLNQCRSLKNSMHIQLLHSERIILYILRPLKTYLRYSIRYHSLHPKPNMTHIPTQPTNQ